MNHTFNILEISDLQIGGANPFSSGGSRNSSAMSGGTTLTLKPGADWKILTVTDDDASLNDGDGSQASVGAITVNGTTYPSGSDVEVEYSYVVRPQGATGASQDVIVYVIEIDSDIEAIATSAPLQPGITYVIQPGQGSDDPSVPYASLFICFAAGTSIATPQGLRAVQDLRAGDLVLTADDGPQPLVWAGGRRVLARAEHGPVTFQPGALGNDRVLRLSPQHQVVQRKGAGEVLVPAKALIGRPDVLASRRAGAVDWFHLALERHQILFAAGAAVESLFPGPEAARMLGADLPELRALLPGFGRSDSGWVPARPVVRPSRWRRDLAVASWARPGDIPSRFVPG